MKILVAYFSAEKGRTAAVANVIAESLKAELFEIKPTVPYSKADLRWINPFARCNKEKMGKKEVPVTGKIENFSDYDAVFLGFPIWYGSAPNVVNTFCKAYDWSGKTVVPFYTSGGSRLGEGQARIEKLAVGARVLPGRRFTARTGEAELKTWIASL